MAIDLSQFRDTYFEESFENLDAMEQGLLDLGRGVSSDDAIQDIFRAAHSIKGGSGTFGFQSVTDFTHLLEAILDEMRDGRRQTDSELTNVLLRSVDALRTQLVSLRDDVELDAISTAEARADLEKILHVTQCVESRGDQEFEEEFQPSDDHGSADSGPETLRRWSIEFAPHAHLLQTGNDPHLIFEELRRLGELNLTVDTSHIPEWTRFDPESCYLRWSMELATSADRRSLEEAFEWVEGDCELSLDERVEDRTVGGRPGTREPHPEAQPSFSDGPRSETRAEARRAASIRVGTDKIDVLMNMVGELVITQSMLSQIVEEFSVDRVDDLRSGVAELEQHTRALQDSVMRIRMLPISFAFNRLPRIVHDTSAKLGKTVALQFSGENTEVDKTVLEKIGDPLVHIVRNALDHGFEDPEDRVAAGKPRQGTLSISASHQGGNVVIEVRDDGRGLDLERILEKARSSGIVGPEDQLSPGQIADLVFHAGLSTSDQISDVSGRGVGMDVVRCNISSLGGVVTLRTAAGVGTTVTIRLPLTLAILDGQLVRVGNDIYVLPLVSVSETLQIDPRRMRVVAGTQEVYRLQGSNIPILHLNRVLGSSVRDEDQRRQLLVVIENDGEKTGLVVDELLTQQQVVIKSLEANYVHIPGIEGATILGDGMVALILDVNELLRMSQSRIDLGCAASAHAGI